MATRNRGVIVRDLHLYTLAVALLLGAPAAQAQSPVYPGEAAPEAPAADALPGTLLVPSAAPFERQQLFSALTGSYFRENRFDGLHAVKYGAGTLAVGYTITEQLAVAGWFSGYRLSAPSFLGEPIQSGNQGLQVVFLPYTNRGPGALRGVALRGGLRVSSGASIVDGWAPTASPFFDAVASAAAGPVQLDGQLGFLFDRSNGLTKPGLVPDLLPEDGILDPTRRYAYHITESNQLRWGAAARIPLLDGRVTPFLEYRGTLYFSQSDPPQAISIGAKAGWPLRSRRVGITAAGDFAFAGTDYRASRPRAPTLRGWILLSFSSPIGHPRPSHRNIRPIGPPHNGGGGPPPALPTGNLLGRVTDSATGRPLSGVLVEFNGVERPPLRTSDAGTFRVDRIPSGTINVRVSAPNYSTFVRSVRIEGGVDTQVSIPIQPEAPSTGLVEGTVTSKRNEPLAAKVTVRRGGATVKQTTTGLDGTFAIEVPPGSYTIFYEADGYVTKSHDIQVVAGGKYNYVKSLFDQN